MESVSSYSLNKFLTVKLSSKGFSGFPFVLGGVQDDFLQYLCNGY